MLLITYAFQMLIRVQMHYKLQIFLQIYIAVVFSNKTYNLMCVITCTRPSNSDFTPVLACRDTDEPHSLIGGSQVQTRFPFITLQTTALAVATQSKHAKHPITHQTQAFPPQLIFQTIFHIAQLYWATSLQSYILPIEF